MPRDSDLAGRTKRRRMHRSTTTRLYCAACGWTPPGGLSPTLMHAHHVIPFALGGPDKPENLVILCPNHHAVAHALWPMSRSEPWAGPTTPAHLTWALRRFEADPVAYRTAELKRALDATSG